MSAVYLFDQGLIFPNSLLLKEQTQDPALRIL